jgi:MoaA/NifB/PqqE/SkfB family radical SAM enzyme
MEFFHGATLLGENLMRLSNSLDKIGFYTLSDERAKTSSVSSRLQRCELILTDRCSFKCSYCRGLRSDLVGELAPLQAYNIIKLWIKDGLKNVRFSGGEPTLYPKLEELVRICKRGGVERIAVSTNGASNLHLYKKLVDAGVNDFSISLDACCTSLGDTMSGVKGAWTKVVSNIKALSKLTYVTIGMVFTEHNIDSCFDNIMFADSLGISDIRVIPSAQYNRALSKLSTLPSNVLDKYPILNYRINNVNNNRHVRGINMEDCNKCPLVLDDMAVVANKHFPCIIYMREQGDPIGVVNPNMRLQRLDWFKKHDTKKDPICSKNCLDVCTHYNNTAVGENMFIREYLKDRRYVDKN